MKLTFNSSKKKNSKEQICELLIILPPCKRLQWGQEVGNTVTPTKGDDLQSCAGK